MTALGLTRRGILLGAAAAMTMTGHAGAATLAGCFGHPMSDACRMQPVPGKSLPWIDLAARRDVAVTDQVGDRIAPAQDPREARECAVLSLLVDQFVGALQLDADREVVAPLATPP